MTVKQLIKKLETMPQNSQVVVDGYEGGVDDIKVIAEVKIGLDYNQEQYYGRHEIGEGDVKAVHLRANDYHI